MKRFFLLGILVLVLAACSTSASPTPIAVIGVATAAPIAEATVTAAPEPATAAPIAEATATAAPEPATAAPIAEVPATAAPIAEATATAAPEPATAAPATSPLPANAVIPIVDPHQGFLLGGTRNGTWLTADAIAPLLVGNETYRLYSPTAARGDISGTSAEFVGEPCPDVRMITLSGGTRTDLVAVAGTWNALPRVPEVLSTDSPVYREAIATLLREQGMTNPEVAITRILRIDLNNDGVNEVLLTASHMANGGILPGIDAGDYAVVVLRMVVGSDVQTIIIDQDIYLTANEFAAPTEFELRGVADLNGDGRLEVLIDSQYYEGAALQVYEVDRAQVTRVLGAACGA